jgi:sirohydrochlorin ferrochelatase
MTTAAAVLVAASHGTSDPAGRRAVAALVAAVAARDTAVVREAFVDVQEPDVSAALAAVPDEPVVIVPLLLSAGFHVRVDLAREARHAGAMRGGGVAVADALGPDPRLITILARRLADVPLEPGVVVVLAAAGSSDGRAVDDCRATAAALGERIGVPVTAAFISAAEPELRSAVAQAREHGAAHVVVATYLLAPGYFADLAATAGADAVTPPLLCDGEAPPAELVEIVLDRYRAADVSSVLRTSLDLAGAV